MLTICFIFLALAVLFGSIILNAIFKNKRTPKPIVFMHGAMALFAILVMIGYIIASETNQLLNISFGLLAIAALGGITLLSFDIRRKPLSKMIVVVHPLIALSGIVVLIVYVLK